RRRPAMSEDRLEEALREMKQESVDAAAIGAARARVWSTLTTAAAGTCAELRPDLRSYLSGSLTTRTRVPLDDHRRRCATGRAAPAEMKGERRVIAMPARSSSGWRSWGTLVAAAAVLFSVLYLGRDSIDAWMAPGGPRATVVSASGGLY